MAKVTNTKNETTSSGQEKTVEGGEKRTGISVRLQPVDNSDQPIVANHIAIHSPSSMVMIDFGFIEPSALAALPRMAKQGKNLPEVMNGKLAVRVALGGEALNVLHMQLTQLLSVGKRMDAKNEK